MGEEEEAFKIKLVEERASVYVNSANLSKRKYDELLGKVQMAKSRKIQGKIITTIEHELLQKYDVIKSDNQSKLVTPRLGKNMKYYVHDEDLYGILLGAHLSLGHGNIDKMMNELEKKYKNITYRDMSIFLSVCTTCKELKSEKTETNINTLNSLCQFDLVSFTLYPDRKFRFIMIYQENSTKFIILKPLKTDDPVEVADNLLDIFTLIGPPSFLQSAKGSQFVDSVIKRIREIWCDLQIHSIKEEQDQPINVNVENLITTWFRNNNSSKWVDGLQFVQLTHNTTYNESINKTPYEALFNKPSTLNESKDSPEEEEKPETIWLKTEPS